MARFSLIITSVVLAVVAPWLIERFSFFSTILANAPHRLQTSHAFRHHEVRYADRIRNCEDVLLVESKGVALVACDAGREDWNTVMRIKSPIPQEQLPNAQLMMFDYKGTGTLRDFELVGFDAKTLGFHTLGMEYDEDTKTLFAVNHGYAGGTIEMFRLDWDAMTATHLRTLKHELMGAPNSLALINSHSFYLTNDHWVTSHMPTFLSKLETFTAPPIAPIVHVDFSSPDSVDVTVVARLPFANGIVILNDTTVAVASTTKGAVNLFARPIDQPNGKFTRQSVIKVPFMPDNLSLSIGKKPATLMIAGHPSMTLMPFAASRWACNKAEFLASKEATDTIRSMCAELQAGSWVSEWSETEGLKHVYVDNDYPTSATAVYDAEAGKGIIAGLYAKGILVWDS